MAGGGGVPSAKPEADDDDVDWNGVRADLDHKASLLLVHALAHYIAQGRPLELLDGAPPAIAVRHGRELRHTENGLLRAAASAEAILRDGFRDGEGLYGLVDVTPRGVFLSVSPANINDGAAGDEVLEVTFPASFEAMGRSTEWTSSR